MDQRSGDGWISGWSQISCSLRGIRMPDFEVLDAKVASVLNRIIHNSHFKRRISLQEEKAQKQDRFLCGRQIAFLIYEYFGVTGSNDSVENFADLFTIVVRNDDNQEFDSKWDEILFYQWRKSHLMTSWKIVQIENTRVWETQDRVGICTKWRIIRRELDLIVTDWRWWCREVSSIVWEWRTWKTSKFRTKRRGQELESKKACEQRSPGDCWQWEANGQCSKGDNCSFRHDINKRAKTTQPNPSPRSSLRQNERNASRTKKS